MNANRKSTLSVKSSFVLVALVVLTLALSACSSPITIQIPEITGLKANDTQVPALVIKIGPAESATPSATVDPAKVGTPSATVSATVTTTDTATCGACGASTVTPTVAAPTVAPALSCPSMEDLKGMGTIEYLLSEGGQIAGAHITFSRNVKVTEFNGIDAIHKDSRPVSEIFAGFQGSLWVKTACRPIAETSVATPAVVVPSATPTPTAVCTAPSIAELQKLAQPNTQFEVLMDKGVKSGVHMTFASSFSKQCWTDAIQKDGKNWESVPSGVEVTVWVKGEFRPLK